MFYSASLSHAGNLGRLTWIWHGRAPQEQHYPFPSEGAAFACVQTTVLMIAYVALFSALLSRLTALTWGSTRVTGFIARFLNIHRSGVLTALAWLVPHETVAVSAQILRTPYNHAPCHFMQSHIRNGVCVFSCNLPPARLAEWPGSFTCCCGNTGVERIPKWVSTKSRPWRRTVSRRSSRDSNPRPFNHKSSWQSLGFLTCAQMLMHATAHRDLWTH